MSSEMISIQSNPAEMNIFQCYLSKVKSVVNAIVNEKYIYRQGFCFFSAMVQYETLRSMMR